MRRAADARRPRRGTTLVELMLALSLAGLLLLGVLALVDQASGTGTTLTRHARATDDVANGDRVLRALVARAQPSTDTTRTFVGQPDRARFEGWCDRPAGWMERCQVTLTLLPFADRTSVVATLSTGEEYRLRTVPGEAVFRYYGRNVDGAGWLTAWGESILLPAAVGLVVGGDTIVLRTGERS